MKYLIKFLIPFFREHLIEQISKRENKTFIVSKLNKYIDLPNLSEEEENEVINKVYDAITEITKAYLGKDE